MSISLPKKYSIKINNRLETFGQEDQPLLLALRENKIFLSSACGGKGACGQCKIKAIKGFTQDYNKKELFHIPPEEREQNIRLACQHNLKGNIEISIPEDLLGTDEYKAQVTQIRDLTYDIKEITLDIIKPQKINFKAGQFIQVEIPPYELTKEPVFRPYSLSNPPSKNDIIKMQIRYIPNGISTTFIHKYLKIGDTLKFNGPFGKFYLRKSNKPAIFIAGSTGLSPVRSVLLDMKDKKIKRKILFFFGAVSKKDLFLLDEMKNLEQELYNFKFIPALSNPEPSDHWKGETGLITEVAKRYIESNNIQTYLCGSPGMINACKKVLYSKGVIDKNIFFDRFS